MNLYQKIKELARRKNISVAQIERDLDFSNGSISKWGESLPSIDKVEKVANYFNVSIDYLLGRTENPYPINTAEEDFNDDFIENLEKEEEIRILQRAARNMNDNERKVATDLWKAAFKKAFENEN